MENSETTKRRGAVAVYHLPFWALNSARFVLCRGFAIDKHGQLSMFFMNHHITIITATIFGARKKVGLLAFVVSHKRVILISLFIHYVTWRVQLIILSNSAQSGLVTALRNSHTTPSRHPTTPTAHPFKPRDGTKTSRWSNSRVLAQIRRSQPHQKNHDLG